MSDIRPSHDSVHTCIYMYMWYVFTGRQRLSKNWEENDFYDSDEDSFLDRTGECQFVQHYIITVV